MKKTATSLLFVLLVLTFTPGCRKNRSTKKRPDNAVVIKKDELTNEAQSGDKGIFKEEAIDNFVFDEKAEQKEITVPADDTTPVESTSNIFAPEEMAPEKPITIVDEEAQARLNEAERRQQQARYGFKNIYFEFDESSIKDDQHAALEHDLKIAKKLAEKGTPVVIEGHADNAAGSDSYNFALSAKRADTVADYFQKKEPLLRKIKPSTVGRGSEMRIVPTGDRYEQAPNRRVEFYVESERNTDLEEQQDDESVDVEA